MADKRIRIILDSKGAKRDADSLNDSVSGIGSSADKAQFSVNKLAGAIAAVISVQKIAQFADAFTRVQNQLVRTTNSTQELADTTARLLEVANSTRAGLETTSDLYTSLSVSTKELGLSQEAVIDVTKTINNLFLESGKGAEETAGAVRQLGQALQSGALRGDEFNSVAEGAPGILRAIQQATGKTASELRALAADGAITAEVIVTALQNYSDEAQKAADKTQVTLAQSFVVAENNLVNFIGQIDDATGASGAFAAQIVEISNVIGSAEFISGLINAFEIARLTINSVSDSVGDFSNEMQLAKGIGGDAASFIGDSFAKILPNLKAVVEIFTVELLSGIDKVKTSAIALFAVLSNPLDDDKIRAAMEVYHNEIELINQVREDSIQISFDERQAIISNADAVTATYKEQAAERKALRDSFSPSGGGTIELKGKGPKEKKADDGEREIASAQGVTRSLQAELELRQSIAQIYRENTLAADASLYEQQLAQVRIKEAEELAVAQSKATNEAAQREERLAATLDNDRLAAEARVALRVQFDEQEKLGRQIHQEEITAIEENGKKAREDLARAEFQAKLANVGALGNALISLGQGQSKKIFKVGQTLALAQAAVALPSAVLQSFQNGGGYPFGLIPAGAMLATGIKNIQSIKSAGAGLGGGGGSVNIPSLGGGVGGGSSGQIQSSNVPAFEQKRVIEVRGIDKDSLVTGAQLVDIMQSDDSVIVALSGAQQDAQRRGVI